MTPDRLMKRSWTQPHQSDRGCILVLGDSLKDFIVGTIDNSTLVPRRIKVDSERTLTIADIVHLSGLRCCWRKIHLIQSHRDLFGSLHNLDVAYLGVTGIDKKVKLPTFAEDLIVHKTDCS